MKKLEKLLAKKNTDEFGKIENIRFISNREKDEEFIEIVIVNSDSSVGTIRSEKKHYLYNWKKFLDLNLYEGEKSVYSQLYKLVDLLRGNELDEFIDAYIELQSDLPFLLVLFNDVYKLTGVSEHIITKDVQVLENRINKLIDKFEKYQHYIFTSLIEPYENSKIIDPLRLLFGYEMYLSAGLQESVLAYSVFYNAQRYGSFDVKDSFLSMINEEGNVLSFEMPSVYEIEHYEEQTIYDIFDDLFLSGMHYLIEMEQIPKKCKLCGRYFLNKYSYVANYCNVQYKDTKDTCQEYVAKMNYKAKVSKNEINTEYSKVYNRIYSRVRRGNLLKEDAKFAELKELRDTYFVKYEISTDEVEKDNIIKAFVIEVNRLYATDEMKEEMRKKLGLPWDSISVFNSMAKDKSLNEFKEELMIHKEILSPDDYLMLDFNSSFKKIADKLNEDQWLEIQYVLPLNEAIY